jgi:flagellar basal-body rod modification protein FlgD
LPGTLIAQAICCLLECGFEQSDKKIRLPVFIGRSEIMSTSSVTATASDIQMDYMKLLVTQLQNQNPLEPLDNNEMASQLAQFSQLQQLETMNSSFVQVLASAERSYANSLIGKDVSFVGNTETGETGIINGPVEQVFNNIDGEILLIVGNHTLGLEEVISVKN